MWLGAGKFCRDSFGPMMTDRDNVTTIVKFLTGGVQNRPPQFTDEGDLLESFERHGKAIAPKFHGSIVSENARSIPIFQKRLELQPSAEHSETARGCFECYCANMGDDAATAEIPGQTGMEKDDEKETVPKKNYPDEVRGFHVDCSVHDVEIDCRSPAKKWKQKLPMFSTGQMEKELGSSDPSKLQNMVVSATESKKISTSSAGQNV
jgi:hypothetical protein